MSNEDVSKTPLEVESPPRSIVTPDWFISRSVYVMLGPIHNSEALLVVVKVTSLVELVDEG